MPCNDTKCKCACETNTITIPIYTIGGFSYRHMGGEAWEHKNNKLYGAAWLPLDYALVPSEVFRQMSEGQRARL